MNAEMHSSSVPSITWYDARSDRRWFASDGHLCSTARTPKSTFESPTTSPIVPPHAKRTPAHDRAYRGPHPLLHLNATAPNAMTEKLFPANIRFQLAAAAILCPGLV